MNRRELLAAAAAVFAGSDLPEPLTRLLDGLASSDAPGRVGRSEVEAVRHATVVYTAMDLRFGGGVAADVSSGALRWAVGLLDAPMRDRTRIALSAAVGALADRAAWTHFDAGRGYSARRLSTLALRTSDAAADPDLRAHVVLNMAAQVGDDHPRDAAALVESALADKRVCGPERANLHGVLGRHLANSGDKRRALRHVAVAEALAARGGETPGWLGFVTDAHLDSIITRSLAAAGEDREAVRRLEGLLPRLGAERARGRAGRMIDLGDLYARTGRLDEAGALADRAGAVLADVRSARSAASLHALRRRVSAA
ncbi:hypothetical protein AB0I60_31080 [Actinosynnema sp. NPDC050436]|uniref:hypothetical protein n=1 Tax=Actinosynnema sp. NPDC050436 TaxID=3155659 RepID=UPI00340B971F